MHKEFLSLSSILFHHLCYGQLASFYKLVIEFCYFFVTQLSLKTLNKKNYHWKHQLKRLVQIDKKVSWLKYHIRHFIYILNSSSTISLTWTPLFKTSS
jgi:hypothetical protein